MGTERPVRGVSDFALRTGELLSAEEHEKHLALTLPNEGEKKFVANLMHEPGWIAPREEIVS